MVENVLQHVVSCYLLRFSCTVLKVIGKFGERRSEVACVVASSNVSKVKENVGGFQR